MIELRFSKCPKPADKITMDCQRVRDILLDYRERDLGQGLDRKVDEHLRLCEACAEELRKTEALFCALAALPVPDPWPGFSRRLSARIEENSRDRLTRLRVARPVLAWVGGFVFVVLALAVVWRIFPVSGPAPSGDRTGDVALAEADWRPALAQREIERVIGVWGGAGADRSVPSDWPGRTAILLAFDEVETAPEEAVRLWKANFSGVGGLEGLVELAGGSDREVDRLLERIR